MAVMDEAELNHYMDRIDPFRPHRDRQGRPISVRQWAELHQEESYVRVAEDHLDDGHIWVSTVWLGMDHRFGLGPPLIFETMAFIEMTDEQREDRRRRWQGMGFGDGDFPWNDFDIERYATEDEARDGHRRMVDSLTLRIEIFQERDQQ